MGGMSTPTPSRIRTGGTMAIRSFLETAVFSLILFVVQGESFFVYPIILFSNLRAYGLFLPIYWKCQHIFQN